MTFKKYIVLLKITFYTDLLSEEEVLNKLNCSLLLALELMTEFNKFNLTGGRKRQRIWT